MRRYLSLLFLLAAMVALTAATVTPEDWKDYITAEEREQVISQTIKEVKEEFRAREEARKNRVQTQDEKDGKYTSTQLLARFFKRPSKQALKLGLAQLMYEEMVKRADRRISEIKRKQKVTSQAEADSPMAKAEAIADELFHKTGSLLSSEEIGRMWEESECVELRPEPNCRFPTVNRFRTIDGTCNNLENPLLGAADTAFARLTPPLYEDGVMSLRGDLQARSGLGEDSVITIGPFAPPNPSARHISETVIFNVTQDELPFTHLLMQWGQFLDHDLSLGPELEEECEGCKKTEICAPIPVADLDRTFGRGTPNDGNCIPFRRSLPVCEREQPLSFEPREQVNVLTSFIDGSMVYGSSDELARAVRAFEGGLLLTGPPFPGTQPSLPVDVNNKIQCPNRMGCFLCGEVRCNEQFSLSIMHTIFLREHNLCATNLARINPFWDDERLYQECRRIVGALIQKITYEDYLIYIFGPQALDFFLGPYEGYDPEVDPSIPNSFATAAYRYGHSLIRPQFDRLDVNYRPLPIGPLSLADAFFNPDQFRIGLGTDPIVRGWVNTNSRRMDEFLNSVLTTQLFGNTFSIPLDLASLNIQRGRDHGLAPYPVWRNFCFEVFGRISGFENKLTLVRFLQLYGSLETLDLWIGGLAEDRLPESLLGATFNCLFGLTFARVRDGDRFFYRRPGVFTPAQLAEIRERTISKIFCDTSDNIQSIQPNGFLSNQTRVPCSQLPDFDYSLFAEETCFARVQVRPRNVPVRIFIFSRSVTPQFISMQVDFPASSTTKTRCLQIQCPTSESPLDLFLSTTRGLVDTVTISANNRLPADTDARPGVYRGEISSTAFASATRRLFRSSLECESESTRVAFTIDASGAAAEAQNSEDDETMGIPDDVLDEILSDTKMPASSQEKLEEQVDVAAKFEKQVTDDALLQELESVLKKLTK